MDILKKEWKSIVMAIWLVGITLFLFKLDGKLDQLQLQTAKLAENLEVAEGVIISVDSGVVEANKKIKSLQSQVDYVAKRVRRR